MIEPYAIDSYVLRRSWNCFIAGTVASRPTDNQPIEQIPLGGYVHSLTAAERTEFGFDASWVSGITAEDHRTVRLQMEKRGGGRVQIQLLRDVLWVEMQGCIVGETIFLNMPELGVEGIADVLAIEPCPPLETLPADCNPSQYRLVTGTIQHESGATLDLKLTSEPAPIGVIPSYPIWSVDQQDWINAADLKPGETVKTLTGTAKVETISERDFAEPVYNIEVEGDHIYRVGESGALVHNASKIDCVAEFDPGALDSLGRATGVVAIISPQSVGGSRTDFDDNVPTWWDQFRQQNPLAAPDRWEKGHLLASQLGSPGGAEVRNLVPLHRLTNTSAMVTCENRIAEAAKCGHFVLFEARPSYTGSNIYPDSVHIKAESNCGFRLDATVQNVANPKIPGDCSRTSPNRVRC